MKRRIIQLEENNEQIMNINKDLEIQAQEGIARREESPNKTIKRAEWETQDEIGIETQIKNIRKGTGNTKTGKTQEQAKEMMQTNNGKKTCINYAKTGECRFKDQCKYDHVKKRNWGNRCKRHDCWFSHDESIICKWHKEGICRFGEQKCRYIHQKVKETNSQEGEENVNKDKKQEQDMTTGKGKTEKKMTERKIKGRQQWKKLRQIRWKN